jgi:hypothetical protein
MAHRVRRAKMEKDLWKYKFPFEYQLFPTGVYKGQHWLTLRLKNIGRKTLQGLDVELHSLDTYFMVFPYGSGQYIEKLKPNEEIKTMFRVTANGTADVYATVRITEDEEISWWESGWTRIYVKEEKADLERLLVLSHPYTTIGKTLSVEATVKGLRESTGLKLEFWVEPPSGKSEKQAEIKMKELSVGEEARYTAEFTPKETGWYTVYAYLYDEWRRIGHKTTTILAERR